MTETYNYFNYLVYHYYNQYYATEATTLKRRQYRNMVNNNISIQQNNKNYYNKNLKYYFYNPPNYSYAFIEYPPINNYKKIMRYVLINSCWNLQGCFNINKNTNLQTYLLGCNNKNNKFGYINFNNNIGWYNLSPQVQQKYKIQMNHFGNPSIIQN